MAPYDSSHCPVDSHPLWVTRQHDFSDLDVLSAQKLGRYGPEIDLRLWGRARFMRRGLLGRARSTESESRRGHRLADLGSFTLILGTDPMDHHGLLMESMVDSRPREPIYIFPAPFKR